MRDLISKAQAIREEGVTRNRLNNAIAAHEIEAVFVGARLVKVRRDDVRRLIQSPPQKDRFTPISAEA